MFGRVMDRHNKDMVPLEASLLEWMSMVAMEAMDVDGGCDGCDGCKT